MVRPGPHSPTPGPIDPRRSFLVLTQGPLIIHFPGTVKTPRSTVELPMSLLDPCQKGVVQSVFPIYVLDYTIF